MNSKATVLFFALLLAGLSVVNLVTPSRTFSENENRMLQQVPPFSVSALASGKYTTDLDKYITDQFVFRDGWVGVKALLELTIQKHATNGVYFGKDGYLMESFDNIDQVQYTKNLDVVARFSQRLEQELGIQAGTMLVPTAALVLHDKLPSGAPEVDQRALLDQAGTVLPGFVDVSGTLAEHKDEYLYYKTDHHWTSLGALYSYSHWREQGGHPSVSVSQFSSDVLSDEFYGTTYSKASLYTAKPDTITAYIPSPAVSVQVDYNQGEEITDTIYQRSFLDQKDKYSVFLNANQPTTRITTSTQNGRKLLLVKDSYANAFVQMALPDYEEIHVIDLRYFQQSVYDYIEENGVTDVLLLYTLKGFCSNTNLYPLTT